MKKKISNTLTYIIFLLLGVLLLWLCFRKINFTEVLDYVKTAKYSWMLLSLACLGISLFFRALRWNILIESLGYKTRVSSTYESVLIAYFANTVFPTTRRSDTLRNINKKRKHTFRQVIRNRHLRTRPRLGNSIRNGDFSRCVSMESARQSHHIMA